MQGRDRHDGRSYDSSMEKIQTVIRVKKPMMRSAGRLFGQPQVITEALVARSTRGCGGKNYSKSRCVRAVVCIAMVKIPKCSSHTLGAMTRIKDAIGGGGSILQEPKIRGN